MSTLKERLEEKFTNGIKGHGLRVQFGTHSTIATQSHLLASVPLLGYTVEVIGNIYENSDLLTK